MIKRKLIPEQRHRSVFTVALHSNNALRQPYDQKLKVPVEDLRTDQPNGHTGPVEFQDS